MKESNKRTIVPDPNFKNWVCVIGSYAKPIATVKPGETVVLETMDAFGNMVDTLYSVSAKFPKRYLPRKRR